MKMSVVVVAIAGVLALTACEREARRFSEPASTAMPADAIRLSPVNPGGTQVKTLSSNPAEQNAYAVSQGQRLFSAFNCTGCHAHGGGSIGPALMDDKWIYGSEPANVYATIVEGRPNGMPAFGGRIPEAQVWQLVAYVRSLSGQLGSATAPGRADAMQAGKPPAASDPQTPRQVTTPQPQ